MIQYLPFIFISMLVSMILVFLYVFKDDIRAFLMPSKWNKVTMVESDNNLTKWLQKKTPDLRFKFNEGYYNMFHGSNMKEVINKRKVPLPNGTFKTEDIKKMVPSGYSVYREGRLAHFLYIEGNEDPIDLRQIESTGNPQIISSRSKIDFANLMKTDKTKLEELWSLISPFVIIMGIAIIIMLLVNKG